MALIKCSECGKDISDKTSSCPNCGNPMNTTKNPVVQVANPPGQTFKVEPELTSKTWKKVKLISWGVIVFGFLYVVFSEAHWASPGSLILFLGVIALITALIGAWYADKRTR